MFIRKCNTHRLQSQTDSRGRNITSIQFNYAFKAEEEPFTATTDDYFVVFLTPERFLSKYKKHVVFVLDVSGSMSGTRMDLTKRAMYDIIGALDDTDHFNIVTFSSNVIDWPSNQRALQATVGNKRAAEAYVRSLQADGGTYIEGGLRAGMRLTRAFSREHQNSQEELVQFVFFMTDGEPTEGMLDPYDIARMATGEHAGVKIHGMALGLGADFNVVRIISDRTGGKSKL